MGAARLYYRLVKFEHTIFALPFAIAVALFASARGSERDIVERMRFTLPLSLGVSVLANLVLFPLAGIALSLFGSEYSDQGVEILRLLADHRVVTVTGPGGVGKTRLALDLAAEESLGSGGSSVSVVDLSVVEDASRVSQSATKS